MMIMIPSPIPLPTFCPCLSDEATDNFDQDRGDCYDDDNDDIDDCDLDDDDDYNDCDDDFYPINLSAANFRLSDEATDHFNQDSGDYYDDDDYDDDNDNFSDDNEYDDDCDDDFDPITLSAANFPSSLV